VKNKRYGSVIEMLCDMLHSEINRADALEAEVASLRNTQQPHAACPEGKTGRSCETCNYWHDGMCWGESCTDFSEWDPRPASA